MNIINKKVVIELKNERKYFGEVIEIDSTPQNFKWIVLKDNKNSTQIICDNEIIRIEVEE